MVKVKPLIGYNLLSDFQNLHEAYSSLNNGKVDGIMEEMFTAVEFIKNKSSSELSIAQFFEDEHGFGAAIKEDDFDGQVLECLPRVTNFVSDDIYSNVSAYLKSLMVSIYIFYSYYYTCQDSVTSYCLLCLCKHLGITTIRINC